MPVADWLERMQRPTSTVWKRFRAEVDDGGEIITPPPPPPPPTGEFPTIGAIVNTGLLDLTPYLETARTSSITEVTVPDGDYGGGLFSAYQGDDWLVLKAATPGGVKIQRPSKWYRCSKIMFVGFDFVYGHTEQLCTDFVTWYCDFAHPGNTDETYGDREWDGFVGFKGLTVSAKNLRVHHLGADVRNAAGDGTYVGLDSKNIHFAGTRVWGIWHGEIRTQNDLERLATTGANVYLHNDTVQTAGRVLGLLITDSVHGIAPGEDPADVTTPTWEDMVGYSRPVIMDGATQLTGDDLTAVWAGSGHAQLSTEGVGSCQISVSNLWIARSPSYGFFVTANAEDDTYDCRAVNSRTWAHRYASFFMRRLNGGTVTLNGVQPGTPAANGTYPKADVEAAWLAAGNHLTAPAAATEHPCDTWRTANPYSSYLTWLGDYDANWLTDADYVLEV